MGNTILIVDDSSTMRQLVRATLAGAGFAVVEAEHGQDALDKLNGLSNGSAPQLIITDLNMPVMDGFTFIRAIRAMPAHQKTPILMLTTESDDTKKQEGRSAGATGWIVKPFNPDRMLGLIQKILPA